MKLASIGPRNQAKGKLKKSATIALGIEITITKRNVMRRSVQNFLY